MTSDQLIDAQLDELVSALQRLRSTLAATLREAKSAYYNAVDAHGMRRAALNQILCFMRFGEAFLNQMNESGNEEDWETAVPTVDILLALMSLDLGRQELILQPRKRIKDGRLQGGRPRSVSLAILRAYAVAASEALTTGGVPLRIADDTIAHSLRALGCQNTLRAEKLSHRTIGGWRKEMGDHDPVRQLYDEISIGPSESMRDLVYKLNAYEWEPPAPRHELRFPITRGILSCWALMDELRASLPRSLRDRSTLESWAPMWVGRTIPRRT